MIFSTFKNGRTGDSLSAHSSFKSLMVFAVMMLMTASSAMAQEAKFEVIDGLRYFLESDTKTASLLANTNDKYSGDIVVAEKVKSSDGVEYSVTSFGEKCFYECSSLTSITIPSSVTSLGDFCFDGCSGLTSITLPSSVTSLGYSCFSDCSGLASITIPFSVTSLGDYCFRGCRGLTSITLPSSITSLSYNCFVGCSGLTTITIPPSVTSLDYGSFSYCSGLTSITLPSSVTSLGRECFRDCRGLTSITIPSSVTSLGSWCFYGCSGLTSITIPSSVTSLGGGCFRGCSGLTSITIPSSVASLDDYCFSDCSGLEIVYFKGKVPKFSLYSGFKPGIPTTCIIKVPTEYLQAYKDAFGKDYKYIYAWNPDESGDDDKPVTQCATPSISYEAGELKFACETAGAKYHYTISDNDMATDALSEDGKVSLSAAYNISVYATADGYTASEKAEATLYWINANQETTNINLAKTRGIMATAHDGIVSISGLDNGEVVMFYAADGKLIGSSPAVGGVASCAVSEKMVIAKIGMNTIKVSMK